MLLKTTLLKATQAYPWWKFVSWRVMLSLVALLALGNDSPAERAGSAVSEPSLPPVVDAEEGFAAGLSESLSRDRVAVSVSPNRPAIPLGLAAPLDTSPLVVVHGDRVDSVTGRSGDDQLEFVLERPHHWFTKPGGQFVLGLRAGKLFPSEPDEKLCMTVWNWRNEPIHQELLNPPVERVYEFTVRGKGVYLLTFDRIVDGGKGDRRVLARTPRSFGAVSDNSDLAGFWRRPEFVLGAAAYPERQGYRGAKDRLEKPPPGLSEVEAAEKDAELALKLGLGGVRIVHEGAAATNMDTHWGLELYHALGFYIYYKATQNPNAPILPKYSDTTEPHWKYPRLSEMNRPFFEKTIRETRDFVDHYEILNEVNVGFFNGTPAEYVEIFRDFHSAFAKYNSGQTLSSASPAGVTKPENIEAVASAILPFVDTYSFHSYAPLSWFQEKVEAFHRNLVEKKGFDPDEYAWLIGEINRSKFDDDHEGLDVEYPYACSTLQNLVYCYQSGYKGFFIFELRDMRGTRMNPVCEYEGMLDYFYCPRALWGMTSAFIELLHGFTPAGVVYRDEEGLEVFRFARGEENVYVFINKGAGAGSLEELPGYQIIQKSARTKIYDEMGNRLPSGARIGVGIAPLYMRATTRLRIEPVGGGGLQVSEVTQHSVQ